MDAQQATIDMIFVESKRIEKDGKHYNVLALSDGLRTATVFTNTQLETEDLKEGDACKVTFRIGVNYRNQFDIVPVEISPV